MLDIRAFLGGWRVVRKNRLQFSATTDKHLVMSNAAAASNIVSLDEYRRTRGERRMSQPRNQTAAPFPPVARAVWVYWVPVWVW